MKLGSCTQLVIITINNTTATCGCLVWTQNATRFVARLRLYKYSANVPARRWRHENGRDVIMTSSVTRWPRRLYRPHFQHGCVRVSISGCDVAAAWGEARTRSSNDSAQFRAEVVTSRSVNEEISGVMWHADFLDNDLQQLTSIIQYIVTGRPRHEE